MELLKAPIACLMRGQYAQWKELGSGMWWGLLSASAGFLPFSDSLGKEIGMRTISSDDAFLLSHGLPLIPNIWVGGVVEGKNH